MVAIIILRFVSPTVTCFELWTWRQGIEVRHGMTWEKKKNTHLVIYL